jgi:DNA-binding PadR family transcriptional regulator
MSVRHALLGLLAQKPQNGYELRAAFEALIGGGENWDVKPAQVYTTLERLESAGLVTKRASAGGKGGRGKGTYAVTAAGRASLREWFSQGVDSRHVQDEFFVKLAVCLASGEAEPTALIQAQRVHLLRQLHEATAIRDSYDPHAEMAQILLMDKAMMHLEADLRWLDITEQRLEEVKKQPPRRPVSRPRGRPRKDSGERSSQ